MALDDNNRNGLLPFTIVAEQDGGTSSLRLVGEFDLACSEQARRVFELTGMNEIVPVIDATGRPS